MKLRLIDMCKQNWYNSNINNSNFCLIAILNTYVRKNIKM